jgi:peptidoglycan/LPS O-acetylase OafA/YrhL
VDKLTEVARRNNNFDALRIAAAVAVILGHATDLRGHPENIAVVLGLPVSQLGVAVFFVISGYLITGSWERRPHLPRYLTSRVLRIIPGLALVTVVAAFVLGPLVTTLSPQAYFGSGETYAYLRNAVLVPNYVLPGVFDTNPYPVAVNGSLWTLPAEFACYLVVPVLGWLPKRLRVPAWVLFGLASVVLATVLPLHFSGVRVESAAGMWVFFAGGALIRLMLGSRRIRMDIAVVILIVWLVVVGIAPQIALYAAWLALPYCLLAFGVQSTPGIRRASRFGDLSYGLYLWAFPVQQTLVHFWGVLPWGVDVVAVTLVTAVFAYASWHLVERPCMDLAQKLPWAREAIVRPTAIVDTAGNV